MIPVDDYVAFLDRDYLHGYVDGGGAALKFVVPPDDDLAQDFMEKFAQTAGRAGFQVAQVDAAENACPFARGSLLRCSPPGGLGRVGYRRRPRRPSGGWLPVAGRTGSAGRHRC